MLWLSSQAAHAKILPPWKPKRLLSIWASEVYLVGCAGLDRQALALLTCGARQDPAPLESQTLTQLMGIMGQIFKEGAEVALAVRAGRTRQDLASLASKR